MSEGGNRQQQARGGQNAQYPWGPYPFVRGRVAEAVDLTDSAQDQTLLEAVDEPIILGLGQNFPQYDIGWAIGTNPAGIAGTVVFIDADGNEYTVGALAGVFGGPPAAVSFAFLLTSGVFLLAPGEKIVFRAVGAGTAGRFYPNAGYVPNGPTELKPYRVNLEDGARHLVAQAPAGATLVCAAIAADGAFPGWGLIANNNGAPVTVNFYVDDVQVSTQAAAAGLSAPAFASSAFVLPAGAKLEAQLTAAQASPVRVMVSLRQENGS